MPDPSNWPRLDIDIEALQDKQLEGSFEVGPFPSCVTIFTYLPLYNRSFSIFLYASSLEYMFMN
jgi:hypothetical protein